MDACRKWRFRFGLRGLFALVALSAIAISWGLHLYRRPPYEARQIYLGMSYEAAAEALSDPSLTQNPTASTYQLPCAWGELWTRFENGRCMEAGYFRYSDSGKWLQLQTDGTYRPQRRQWPDPFNGEWTLPNP